MLVTDIAHRAKTLVVWVVTSAVVLWPVLGWSQQASAVAAGAASSHRAGRRAATVVLDHVNVIDVQTGRIRSAQRVVISGRHVDAVGPVGEVKLPAGARIVDARGKYLIPGLWDMHVHVESRADVFFPLFVAYGITGVRDAGSRMSLATLSRWKREIADGERVGPRLFVAGPLLGDCPPPPETMEGGAHVICLATASEARLVVDFLKLAGADFIKPYGLQRELHLAVAAEARRIGIPFGGHFVVPGQEASDSGARFLDHQTWFDPNVCGEWSGGPAVFDQAQCTTAAERLRHNGTWLVDTPGGFGMYFFPERYAELWRRYLPDSVGALLNASPLLKHVMATRDSLFPQAPRRPASFTDWQAIARSPLNPYGAEPWKRDSSSERLAWRNFAELRGMPILAGTDAMHLNLIGGVAGYSLHEVLVYFVLGGMTPLEALQTATLNPAEALHATDSLGTVAAGKLADLVLLDANPLADIWNTTKIRAVVANGRYFDRVALDRLLMAAEHAAHR